MSSIALLMNQIVIMFLYMGVGFCLFKAGKISAKGSGDIASLLVWLVIPIVIINSFCVERTPERLTGLLLSTVASIVLLGIAMLISKLTNPQRPIDNFAAAFSNAGFIGIPLVQATLGAEAVFYIAPMIALLNILQWTYGVAVITRSKVAITRKTFLNPIVVGTVIALILFLSGLGIKLPVIAISTVKGLANLNAPLAMLVLGVYIAQANFKSLFTDWHLYLVSGVRLLLIPVISILLCMILPIDKDISLALIIAASAPVGANVAVYAQLHKLDYVYASKTVVISTLFSAVTLPLILLLAETVL